MRDAYAKALGPDSLDAIRALTDVADMYHWAHRMDQATKLYEEVLDQWMKKLGPNNINTLIAQRSLAALYDDNGRVDEALKLFEQARDRELKTLGPDHPETLATRGHVAEAYRALGRVNEAITLFEQIRDEVTKKYGPENKRTLDTLEELCYFYESAGRTAESIQLGDQIRDQQAKRWKQTLRPAIEAALAAKSAEIAAHNPTAATLPSLLLGRARLFLRLGRFEEANADLARRAPVRTDIEADDAFALYYRSCLLAYLGDTPTYGTNCKTMFERFSSSSDGPILDKTAKSSLLLPHGAGGDPKQMLALIERAMKGPHDRGLWAYYSLNKGLALYRLGNFSACLEWSQKVKVADDFSVVARTASADLLIAMAQSKLGHSDQARAAFDAAKRRTEKHLFKAGEGDLDSGWVEDWLIYQTLHREAEMLLKPSSATTRPPAPATLPTASTQHQHRDHPSPPGSGMCAARGNTGGGTQDRG